MKYHNIKLNPIQTVTDLKKKIINNHSFLKFRFHTWYEFDNGFNFYILLSASSASF